MRPAEPAIRASGVWKGWSAGSRRIEVLRGVDLEVRFGESLAVVGPSGSGKSTLLHLLGLLVPPGRGTIEFHDSLAGPGGQRGLALRRSIGFVFQDAKLIPGLSVLENVCVPLSHRDVWPSRQEALATGALESVGLGGRLHHRPDELSGGELVRAGIARALVFGPRVLLADEPTGSLDSKTGEAVAELLVGIVRPRTSLVMATHNSALAERADRILRIRDGIVEPYNGP